MRATFWKNVCLERDILGRSACRNRGGFGKLRFWSHFEKVRGRKWRWRTLDILSDQFWNYVSQFHGNCKENGCGLGFLRILFLYRIQFPIFPIGVALFFHMALFFQLGRSRVRAYFFVATDISDVAIGGLLLAAEGRPPAAKAILSRSNSGELHPSLSRQARLPQFGDRFFIGKDLTPIKSPRPPTPRRFN